jgi:hypothetical protein
VVLVNEVRLKAIFLALAQSAKKMNEYVVKQNRAIFLARTRRA